ncbi:MAG: lipopolysaccharide biosynthesis protein [Bacteroides sp.]
MSSLKQQMMSGVMYTAVAKYSGIVISLVVMAVLARLLTPDDFGVVAIATVFIAFFELFTNIGFSSAIIQNKELTTKDLSNIYSFTLWMGLGLSLLFFASSWGIASYYGNSTLRSICQILSVNLFLSSASMVPNTLFYKEKQFKLLAIRTLCIQLITGATAIFAAWQGAGLYTLTIQPLLSGLLLYLISIKYHPVRPAFTLGLESIRKIWGYSIYQFLFNIINYFTNNLDKLLIGKYLGMDLLGYYEKSYRTMMLPVQNITYVITPVLHPILSDYQNDIQQLRISNEKIVHLLSLFGFPISILSYYCANEAILILFGEQWHAAVPVFQILSLTIGIQMILSSSGSFYQSGGNTRSMFYCAVFASTTTALGLCIGIFYFKSLIATSWCIVLSFILSFIQCYTLLYKRVFSHSMASFYKQILSAIILSSILFVCLWAVKPLIQDTSYITSLAIKSIIFLLIYAIFIRLSGEYRILVPIFKRNK